MTYFMTSSFVKVMFSLIRNVLVLLFPVVHYVPCRINSIVSRL